MRIIYEHKTLNKTIRAALLTGEIPELYRIQMEQQLLIYNADKCLFMASKWDDNDELIEEMHCWYEPDLELRERIVKGWEQLEADKKNYVPVQIAKKPIADAVTDLPALFVQAKGEITAHNMEAFGESLKISLANTRSLVLVTDQDYSNAEAAAKLYRETCKKLVLVKEAVLAQATTIGEATRMIDAWHEDLRVTALKLEKDVTEKKEAQKLAIITQARMAYIEHVTALELEIKPIRLTLYAPEFAVALKGKRLISAWHDAANTLLANSKIKADAQANDFREKLSWLKDASSGFAFLFNDLAQIIGKQLEDFKLLVTSRIEAHKVAEAAKLELERERIRIEEESKAKAKAKLEAEALAKSQEDAAAQKAIDDKVRAADEEAARLKRIQDDLNQAREHQRKHQALYDEGIEKEKVAADAVHINAKQMSGHAAERIAGSESVTSITVKDLKRLTDDSNFLVCLRAVGVDNWEGWDDSWALFEERHGEKSMEQAA